ncbi:MAG: hypothetical protein O7J95_11005 [Planctomycetota bacterium]|nr:hypothetical protein [Planctomycetota bacterium]
MTSRNLAAGKLAARLDRKLRGVRQRLFYSRLLRAVCVDLFIFLCLFAALLIVERFVSIGVTTGNLLAGCAGAALVSSLLRVSIWGRVSSREAAVTADSQLELKERVATAVYLRDAGRRDAGRRDAAPPGGSHVDGWSELILEDGVRRIESIALKKHFPVRPPRGAWWLAAPAVLAFLIFVYVPSVDVFGYGEERQAQAEEEKEIDKRTERLDRDLEEVAKEAERQKAPDIQALLKSLAARKPPAPGETPPRERQSPSPGASQARKKALVELTRREDVLKKALQGKKFGDLKKALDKFRKAPLKGLKLTRELRKSLKDGDLKKALKELAGLKRRLEQLAKTPKEELTREERQLLERLNRELANLSRNSKGLGQLSSSLAGLSSKLSSKDFQGALDSLQLSQEQLERLSRQSDQTDLLRQALDLVRLTKQDLASLSQLAKNQKPHRCPDCGKPKAPPNPWQKSQPGGT